MIINKYKDSKIMTKLNKIPINKDNMIIKIINKVN